MEVFFIVDQRVNNMNKKAHAGERPRILWDDNGIRSMYANITEVVASREEIKISFGVEAVRQTGQNEVNVQLSTQIVLHPLVAKQVALSLDGYVREYESRWGSLESAHALSTSATGTGLSTKISVSGTEKGVEKGLALIEQVAELNVEIAFERSFKAVQRQFLENRFLLGINRQDLEDKADEHLTAICRAIDMPHNLLEDFKRYLPDANHIYFGFEESEKSLLYKGYLEFRDRIEEEIKRGVIASSSFLLFVGFKWDTASPKKQATTRYVWYPALPIRDILARLRETVGLHSRVNLLEIVESIVGEASEKISNHDIQYLEVTEEGNPRKSFDINIYKAKLQLEDLYPILLKMMRHYAIPVEKFQHIYESIKTDRFGHLAGGVDREGRDFLTVYYGVRHLNSHHLKSSITVPQGCSRFS